MKRKQLGLEITRFNKLLVFGRFVESFWCLFPCSFITAVFSSQFWHVWITHCSNCINQTAIFTFFSRVVSRMFFSFFFFLRFLILSFLFFFSRSISYRKFSQIIGIRTTFFKSSWLLRVKKFFSPNFFSSLKS